MNPVPHIPVLRRGVMIPGPRNRPSPITNGPWRPARNSTFTCQSWCFEKRVPFANVSARAGPYFQIRHLGRGVALGDLDNDGRTDVVLNPMNEPAVLLRNVHDSGHHWLGVELVGSPYRDAVGARLELEVGGQALLRTVKGGSSYLSSGDRRVIFGLGLHDKVGRLTIRWPSGQQQVCEGLSIDRYWKLTETNPQARNPKVSVNETN